MPKKRRKAIPHKRRVIQHEGGEQCRECRVKLCRQMKACAYYEFVALGEGTTYECPDREEGNPWKLMDAA